MTENPFKNAPPLSAVARPGEVSEIAPPCLNRGAKRLRLFSDLVKIIQENKIISIASTLTSALYKDKLRFLHKEETLSIHAMCFLQAAITQRNWAQEREYQYDIPFMLDKGCPDREDVAEARPQPLQAI